MKKQLKDFMLLDMFISFFKVGLFTIGGGFAMLPMLRKEIVDKHHWATDEEMLDYFAIGQSTPGIIAINTATFIGYNKGGVIGAMVSTLGLVTPSWIIIITIATFYDRFVANQYIESAFMGIRVVVVVLIFNAVLRLGKSSIKNWWSFLISAVAFISIALLNVSAIYIIVLAGILGIIINSMKEGERKYD